MNFKILIFFTLTAGVLLSVFSRDSIAYGESNNNQKINDDKLSTVDRDVINNSSITHIVIGARIITQFSPRNSQGENIDLGKLASDLGYDHFNWVSYVEKDPHGIVDQSGKRLSTPYNDPPIGGYQYDRADRFPFYWDVVNCDLCKQRHHFQNHNNLQQFELVFEDAPADYRLQSGEAIEFITSLVGVKNINPEEDRAEWDILHTFRWKLTNPHPNYSQVSIIDSDVNFSQISPTLLNTMVLDGATIPSATQLSESQ
ncbi:hypothetical protein I4641_04085 [Waterburya agarophytonicola K14]|uniref:Uncharacterized protein n=1 Tax=Waterburya agarophytonicola KI4 TaxID=2874699 RepID=A0A964FG37_9CYAN|nr:hypothetical protein [Waterburya agarophytonicola]MCC0176159.1 hypothetical protein [Waterburya agarophytonicola KI4]